MQVGGGVTVAEFFSDLKIYLPGRNVLDIWLPNLVSTILGAVIAYYSILGFDKRKTKQKRKYLLGLLFVEIDRYQLFNAKLDEIKKETKLGFGTPHRPEYLWHLLSSDVLSPSKDKELISKMQELIGRITNYNSVNDIANLAIVTNSEAANQLCTLRDAYQSTVSNSYKALYSLLKDYQ